MLPFESTVDQRLAWLTDTFLDYFEKWEENVKNRQGNFSKTDRAKMFLSRPTFEGLKISIYSLVEIVPFLLNAGFDYILVERFAKTFWKSILGINGNWVVARKTLTSRKLGTKRMR